jgi:TrpR-related protein YerC/YecD
MKRRSTVDDTALVRLCDVLARLDAPGAVQSFLEDLCTPAELEALSDRWCVVPLLADGVSYRQIHERTGVSVTTIGRVARHLEGGAGGYRAALAVQVDGTAGGEPEHPAG